MMIFLFVKCEATSDVEAYIHRSGRTGRAGEFLMLELLSLALHILGSILTNFIFLTFQERLVLL